MNNTQFLEQIYEIAFGDDAINKGYIRTAKFWSVTTSRHINKWLKGITEVTEVPQEMLTELAG